MMANGWKTPRQIQEDYHIADKTFYAWKDACIASPYRDAIVRPTGRNMFIVEPLWQEFLIWRSKEREQKTLDPHLRNRTY